MSGEEDEQVDKKRRQFLTRATSFVGGVGIVATAVPFAASWLPSERAQAAGAPVEVDLTPIEPGQMLTVEWRGKPVWIIRRTKEMVASLKGNEARLRDPNSEVAQQPQYAKNTHRSIKEEYLLLIGLCTHLGCVPTYRPNIQELGEDWQGGFFCPCHGSSFDLAGRVFTGVPAPINLEVPPHKFISDQVVVIGIHPEEVEQA